MFSNRFSAKKAHNQNTNLPISPNFSKLISQAEGRLLNTNEH